MYLKEIERLHSALSSDYRCFKEFLQKDRFTEEEKEKIIKFNQKVREFKDEVYLYNGPMVEVEKESIAEFLMLVFKLEKRLKEN